MKYTHFLTRLKVLGLVGGLSLTSGFTNASASETTQRKDSIQTTAQVEPQFQRQQTLIAEYIKQCRQVHFVKLKNDKDKLYQLAVWISGNTIKDMKKAEKIIELYSKSKIGREDLATMTQTEHTLHVADNLIFVNKGVQTEVRFSNKLHGLCLAVGKIVVVHSDLSIDDAVGIFAHEFGGHALGEDFSVNRNYSQFDCIKYKGIRECASNTKRICLTYDLYLQGIKGPFRKSQKQLYLKEACQYLLDNKIKKITPQVMAKIFITLLHAKQGNSFEYQQACERTHAHHSGTIRLDVQTELKKQCKTPLSVDSNGGCYTDYIFDIGNILDEVRWTLLAGNPSSSITKIKKTKLQPEEEKRLVDEINRYEKRMRNVNTLDEMRKEYEFEKFLECRIKKDDGTFEEFKVSSYQSPTMKKFLAGHTPEVKRAIKRGCSRC